MNTKENLFALSVVLLFLLGAYIFFRVTQQPQLAYYSVIAFAIMTVLGVVNALLIGFPKTGRVIVVIAIVLFAMTFWNVKVIKVGSYEVHFLDFLTDTNRR